MNSSEETTTQNIDLNNLKYLKENFNFLRRGGHLSADHEHPEHFFDLMRHTEEYSTLFGRLGFSLSHGGASDTIEYFWFEPNEDSENTSDSSRRIIIAYAALRQALTEIFLGGGSAVEDLRGVLLGQKPIDASVMSKITDPSNETLIKLRGLGISPKDFDNAIERMVTLGFLSKESSSGSGLKYKILKPCSRIEKALENFEQKVIDSKEKSSLETNS